MEPKDLIIDGAKFVPNNYAVILNNAEAPFDLHFVQDLLAHSEIGYALTQPQVISSQQVLTFWWTGHFDNGGATGYEKSLAKLGQLKRTHIRKEWSFFFDCITKAFTNKCSNFDVIPIMSQHIGYAIIHQTHFDFASAVLGFIGDRMTEDRNVVYFARFFYAKKIPEAASLGFAIAHHWYMGSLYIVVGLLAKRRGEISQPSSSAHTVRISSSKPKRTKTVPQTQQKRRRIVLRDESDSEEQVPVSEPVVKEAEKVSSQKDIGIGGSMLLKRLRRMYSDETPKESPPSKRYKKQRAQRYMAESVSEDEEAAAKEGDRESLISKEPEFAEATVSTPPLSPTQATAQDKVSSPPVTPVNELVSTADPGTSAEIDIHNLIVPEVLYLEAPPAPINPSTTPIPDANETPELSTTPSVHLDIEDQTIGEHLNMAVDQNLETDQHLEDDIEASIASHTVLLSEDVDSVSSDAANADDTGDAATNADADEAGPSGHATLQAPSKAELVKKHLQGQHSTTHAEVHKIQEALLKQETTMKLEKKSFFKPTFERIAYIEKTQEKQQSQIDEILQNQVSQQSQLNEIQSSVELLVSLLLPADAKKGEKVIKSKCKPDKTLKKKDDGNDPGNSGMGGGHGQGRGLSSRSAGTISHRTSSDTGRRITSDTGKRISSDELLDLDEEISRQLFLKENPRMDFESLMEEEARLKSDKVNSKSEASAGKRNFLR
ncbi:hypothetical protein AgCh_008680 [Apium graveolens]